MMRLFLISILILQSFPLLAESLCPVDGPWLDPAARQVRAESAVHKQMLAQDIVLLGEHHENPLHHRWHVETLKKISDSGVQLVLALEAFPRDAQSGLAQWNQLAFVDSEFVARTGWDSYWRYPIELYMPLFKLAQTAGIPMLGLNASEKLVSRVRQDGWETIPLAEREGISDPARPLEGYVRRLALSYRHHGRSEQDDLVDKLRFKRFVQQQLLWDRAMAQSLVEAKIKYPQALIVAVIGSWHLVEGQGVLHQLRDLDANLSVMQAVPWDEHFACEEYKAGFADVVYLDPGLRAGSQN